MLHCAMGFDRSLIFILQSRFILESQIIPMVETSQVDVSNSPRVAFRPGLTTGMPVQNECVFKSFYTQGLLLGGFMLRTERIETSFLCSA